MVSQSAFSSNMRHALLLIAHGSRRTASNDEIRVMTERVRAVANPRYELIDCAFLELAEPSIGHGIDRLIAGGATRIALLPYFLAAGRHVAEDIPAEVDTKRTQYPDVSLQMLPYLGTTEAMPRLLADMLPESLDAEAATAHG